jgi:hypothetical protein
MRRCADGPLTRQPPESAALGVAADPGRAGEGLLHKPEVENNWASAEARKRSAEALRQRAMAEAKARLVEAIAKLQEEADQGCLDGENR